MAYPLAVALVALATALRWALIPWLGTVTPYNMTMLAAVFAAVLLGIGPGLLGVLLGNVAVEVFVLGSFRRGFEGAA